MMLKKKLIHIVLYFLLFHSMNIFYVVDKNIKHTQRETDEVEKVEGKGIYKHF